MTIKKVFTIAAILGASLTASAQNQTPPANTCETDPAFQQWSFWEGEWSVTARANGAFQGTNRITPVENGCAFREEWTSANGGTGQSLNYYNPNTKKWRQVWVSAGGGGYLIDYEGGLEDGSIKLEGEIFYYTNGKTFPFRGSWTKLDDGTVRQFFEQYNPEKKEWAVWFDGVYARLEKGE
ncbi:hypothetical protein ACFO5Q_10775 [Kordiimonas lipolytica]|uniref:MORN repeat variant n=1 Tax=Kordiimonas lipolytica TaxID=1662421 RepID=A0ABV8UBQ5_9PROT|nr:hypothetical protein [Kordiimonas lipolytica]